MLQVLSMIEGRKKKLEESEFCRWLASDQDLMEDRFSFAPSMAFFVLGFKDILAALKVDSITTEIDRQINTHCVEDLNHWKWYLHDLETLGFGFRSWGDSVTDIFKDIWSDKNSAVRDLVYTTIHLTKNSKDPALRLILIEVLEAAFGAFINCMKIPIHRANVYQDLDYFGKTHVEKEESHSLGSWVDTDSRDLHLQAVPLSPALFQIAIPMIDEVFDLFEDVFTCWYDSRHVYQRGLVPQSERTIPSQPAAQSPTPS